MTACAVAWQVRPRLPCLVSSGKLCLHEPSLFGMRCPDLTMPRPVGVRPLIRPSLWLPFQGRRYFRVANVRLYSILCTTSKRMKVVHVVSSSHFFRVQVAKNDHGMHGLPTCRHCGMRFAKWHSLSRRIARQGCPALKLGQADAAVKAAEADTSTATVVRTE